MVVPVVPESGEAESDEGRVAIFLDELRASSALRAVGLVVPVPESDAMLPVVSDVTELDEGRVAIFLDELRVVDLVVLVLPESDEGRVATFLDVLRAVVPVVPESDEGRVATFSDLALVTDGGDLTDLRARSLTICAVPAPRRPVPTARANAEAPSSRR